jgi:hypothetical protein
VSKYVVEPFPHQWFWLDVAFELVSEVFFEVV